MVLHDSAINDILLLISHTDIICENMEIKIGDPVFASRRAQGSSVLSCATHPTTVVALTDPDTVGRRHGKQYITVRYDEVKKNHSLTDSILFVPEGTEDVFITVRPRVVVSVAMSNANVSAASDVSSSSDSSPPSCVPQVSASDIVTDLRQHNRVPEGFASMKVGDIL